MLSLKRTGKPGLSPENINLLTGKAASRPLKKDHVIQGGDFL